MIYHKQVLRKRKKTTVEGYSLKKAVLKQKQNTKHVQWVHFLGQSFVTSSTWEKNMPMCQPINMYSPGYEQFTCDLQLLDVILRLTLYNNNYRLKKSGVFPL